MAAIIAPVVNFLIVAFILIYYGRKPFADFLADRSDGVAKLIQESESLFAEHVKELEVWQKKAASLPAEVKQMEIDAKSSLEKFQKQSDQASQREAERIKQDAELTSQSDVLKAKINVLREVAYKSVELAENHLEKQMSTKDKQVLIGQYMELLSHGA